MPFAYHHILYTLDTAPLQLHVIRLITVRRSCTCFIFIFFFPFFTIDKSFDDFFSLWKMENNLNAGRRRSTVMVASHLQLQNQPILAKRPQKKLISKRQSTWKMCLIESHDPFVKFHFGNGRRTTCTANINWFWWSNFWSNVKIFPARPTIFKSNRYIRSMHCTQSVHGAGLCMCVQTPRAAHGVYAVNERRVHVTNYDFLCMCVSHHRAMQLDSECAILASIR